MSSGLLALALTAGIGADDPVSSNVRFNREIIRILQRRCLSCHSPGGVSMPLTTYRDVRDWGRAIREEVVEQRMPPSMAAAGYGRFQNALGLTFRETTTLLAWLDGGMPRGEEKDLPPPFDPVAGETTDAQSDLRIDLPPQDVPALEELIIRRVTVDPRLTSDRLVARVDVRPGSRAVVRGALVYVGESERSWVGGWVPWQHTFPAPRSRAFRIGKGTRLTVLLYYRGADRATVDRSAVQLHFADEQTRAVQSLTIDTTGERVGQLTLSAATTIWALQPTIGALQSLELRARRPDDSIEVLLWIPATRPEWPTVLVLEEPITLPANTVLTLATRAGGSGTEPARVVISAWPATEHRR